MNSKFKIVEYNLNSYSTLDDSSGFGSEICTDKQYAYVLTRSEHSCSYVPHPRPGDYWQYQIVSAVTYEATSITILTINEAFQTKSDIYVFCHPVRHHRVGVIRRGQDILENLPRHPHGGQTWGYGGGGPANTCDVIWNDLTGKQNPNRKYPKTLSDLFGATGVLPQENSFAITADVLNKLIDRSGPSLFTD